jgi:hypothetical protein
MSYGSVWKQRWQTEFAFQEKKLKGDLMSLAVLSFVLHVGVFCV